jgi:hypothetical protein
VTRVLRLVGVRGLLLCVLVVVGCFGCGVGSAWGSVAWWHVVDAARPSNIAPGGEGVLSVQAVNLGDASTSGEVHFSEVLPAGLSVVEEGGRPQVSLFLVPSEGKPEDDLGPAGFSTGSVFPLIFEIFGFGQLCGVSGQVVSCDLKAPALEEIEGFFANDAGLRTVKPFQNVEVRVRVRADASAVSGAAVVSLAGGGVPEVSVSREVTVSGAPVAFGASDLSIVPEDEGGAVDAQAGSHPFQLTSEFGLNQNRDPIHPPALPRDLAFRLPAGLLANVNAVAQCSEEQFHTAVPGGSANECPSSTAIGVASVTIDEPLHFGLQTIPVPLFNLAPGRGEPARFGFEVAGALVTLDTMIRTGEDYGATVSVSNITELAAFLSTTVTFWGVPGDPRHDQSRGWACLDGSRFGPGECLPGGEGSAQPFLTLPSSCALPFVASVTGVSWPPEPGGVGVALAGREYSLADGLGRPVGVTGCNELQFSPFIEAVPDVQSASTPTGLSVHVRVPQEVNHNPSGLASASVKSITVALPAGMSVSAAGADGLDACSEAQVGYQGVIDGQLRFSPGQASCPDASKIATVQISSPLLPVGQDLRGSVYLASPAPFEEAAQNPFASLIAMYIVAEDPVSGVLVKLAGKGSLDQATGQLTATFSENPQVPFEDAELHFFGGSRAPLATPAHCGSYTTSALFGPWSADPLDEGPSLAPASSFFQIDSGPAGGPCPGPTLPFAPSLQAGTTNINAGAFSALTTTIGRQDGNQDIQSVQLHMPSGLAGILAGIPLCGEEQANLGTCSPASLIGHTTVSVGLGNEPFSVTGGQVFLTGPYQGAPFGLSIVNPADAGPFHLGKVIVRARIEIDPRTAQLTVTTGAIPHILKGIPLQIKHVNVTIDRPNFTFNPTSCNPTTITGLIDSSEGASSPVSTPFQVTNCGELKFQPKTTITTTAKASRTNGASLNFRIAYPKGAMGSQSWFDEAKFDIPRQLPARLTTIQKACLAATFETNRGACPAASKIGHAIVHTPLLPVPLEGPVYFVSYGGAKFPDAVLVLDGYGVHIELHGETFINGKTGVTSATFRNTPDVPFESIEVNVPTGPFSEFGANLPASAHGSFCGQKLIMPTFFKAQNGLEIKQNTRVGVTGCSTKARIVAHTVKGHNVTLTVYAPAAGKLTATGKGLTTASTATNGTENVTLTLRVEHPGHVRRHLRVLFAPAHGHRQTVAITLRA